MTEELQSICVNIIEYCCWFFLFLFFSFCKLTCTEEPRERRERRFTLFANVFFLNGVYFTKVIQKNKEKSYSSFFFFFLKPKKQQNINFLGSTLDDSGILWVITINATVTVL